MLCMMSIAGRDEQLLANVNSFDIDRPDHPHVAFGGGPHLCAGQHLAKLEMRVLVEEWVKRIPVFSLEPDFVPEFRSFHVKAMSRLPVRWDPSQTADPEA